MHAVVVPAAGATVTLEELRGFCADRLAGCELPRSPVLDDASPTARFAGLVGARPLSEASPGLYARTQMAAALDFYETAWLRDLDLQRMAGS